MERPERMEKHITLLGIFHIAYHVLGLAAGIAIFALLMWIGAQTHDPDAASILMTIGTAVGVLLLVLSVPGIIGGIWLLKRRPWARILVLIVGVLGLIDIPFGTALGVYTLWVLVHDETVVLFSKSRGA